MNNLKRIFSLALATVMVLGMMVVGASAADFTDNEDITHGAAVDVMAALQIINGYEDGSFRPEGKVTRAEMAQMLAKALQGGKVADMGLKNKGSFSDVKTTDWFAEAVEYCASLGIIGGRGNGTFDPYGNVKANEAAKMILVALGFDAEIFELVGANWSANTMRLAQTLRIGANPLTASTLNLFDGIAGVPAEAELTRDQTAQLIYNGIQSNTVVMSLSGVTSGSNTGILGSTEGNRPQYTWSLTGPSLLADKFKATMVEGVLTAADYTAATSSSAAYWDYDITTYDVDGVAETPLSFKFNKDVSDSFRQGVRVIYRTERGNRKTVLAITSIGSDVVDTCAWNDLTPNRDGTTLNGYALGSLVTRTGTGTSATITDTPYDADTLPVYTFLGAASTVAGASYKEYDTANLIDSNGDGRLDCIVVTPVTVAQVGVIRPTYIQIRGLATNVVLANNNVAEGLAVGDFVTYTQNPETGVFTVEKAELVTGVMTASQDAIAGRRPDQVQVAGDWYTVVENYATGAKLKELVSAEVELVLVAGYVVNGKALTATAVSSDAVMAVAKAGSTTQSSNSIYVDANAIYLEVKILNGDNKTENVKVTKIVDAVDTDGKPKATPVNAGSNGNGTKGEVNIGTLYTYTADPAANGCVILTPYAPTTYDDKIEDGSYTVNNGLVTASGKSFRIADDATFFVMATNDTAPKYAAVKGADVAKWYKQNGYAATGSSVYANRASNGFTYIQEGSIILDAESAIPGATGKAVFYGYVTGNAYFTTSSDGRTPYIAVPLWNGTENITVLAKTIDNTTTAAAQGAEKRFTTGTLVSYTDNGDGTANSMTTLGQANDSIIAWDGTSVLKFQNKGAGAEQTVDDKTVVLYVDGTKKAGVADGNIAMADVVDPFDPMAGSYANVYYVKTSQVQNANDHVDVLILDVNNKIGSNKTLKPVNTITLAKDSEGNDLSAQETIKQTWADGAYALDLGTNPTNKPLDDWREGKNLLIKYNIPAALGYVASGDGAQNNTVKITVTGPTGSNIKLEETDTNMTEGGHFFAYNKIAGPNGVANGGTVTLVSGTYSVKITVTVGTNEVTVLSESITVNFD